MVHRAALGISFGTWRPFFIGAIIGLVIGFATLIRVHVGLLCLVSGQVEVLPDNTMMRADSLAQNRKR